MKQTRLLALLLALLLLSSSLFGCQSSPPKTVVDQPTQSEADQPSDQSTEPAVSVVFELTLRNDNPHTAAQDEYLKSRQYDTLTSNMDGKSEMSRPEPIVLKWTRKVTGGRLDRVETAVISEDEAFTNPIRIDSENSRAELTNLELGKTFYWYVEGKVDGQIFKSEVQTFTVSDNAPRNLGVSGVTNCRDLGGWETEDGGKTTQGLLYRTGKFTAVTNEGKKVLLDDLGIKTEIDLRNESQLISQGDTTEKSKLGDSINYVFAPMEWENLGSGNNILTAPVNEESLLKVFEVFGDEANYPIAFHCSIGTDRTGLVAFLVLGLCGVSEENLYRDFLFSGFGAINKKPEIGRINGFFDTVKAASGNTLAEKIENYLLSRGITAEQIATIKRMMK